MILKYKIPEWAFTLPGIMIILSALTSLKMLADSDASGKFEIVRIVILYSSILLIIVGLGLLNRKRWVRKYFIAGVSETDNDLSDPSEGSSLSSESAQKV